MNIYCSTLIQDTTSMGWPTYLTSLDHRRYRWPGIIPQTVKATKGDQWDFIPCVVDSAIHRLGSKDVGKLSIVCESLTNEILVVSWKSGRESFSKEELFPTFLLEVSTVFKTFPLSFPTWFWLGAEIWQFLRTPLVSRWERDKHASMRTPNHWVSLVNELGMSPVCMNKFRIRRIVEGKQTIITCKKTIKWNRFFYTCLEILDRN